VKLLYFLSWYSSDKILLESCSTKPPIQRWTTVWRSRPRLMPYQAKAPKRVHTASRKLAILNPTRRCDEHENRSTDCDAANELARRFYLAQGYQVAIGYRFDKATHPQERRCWRMAVDAFDCIEHTDVDNALSEVCDE